MRISRRRLVTNNSLEELLRSFLVETPPGYRFETMRLQIYPIDYFLPYLRVPTPLNTSPYSYLIFQRKGRGDVQINGDLLSLRSRGAIFVNRGSVVSLRSIHPSTSGWMIMYDESTITRMLPPGALEQVVGLRSPISLSSATLDWADNLCVLLERQMHIETGEQQPVCDHLFAALIERLLAEGAVASPRRIDRSESLDRRFRRLIFEHAITEGSVTFYAMKLNVSENYLLRCVRSSSGRSPKEWIIDVRLMHAQKLLRTTDATIAEIAASSGFEDPSYFGRMFRRRFGMPPRRFRREAGQDSSE